MKTEKVIRYSELIILIGIILVPIVFYSTPLSIHERPPKVGLKEGDIIRLTISDFSFEYNLSSVWEHNVTPGIYLNPIINWDELEEKEVYAPEDFTSVLSTCALFEGNSTNQLHFEFQIKKIAENKYGAEILFLNTSQTFWINVMYSFGPTPFFDPSLSIGLTFSKSDGNTTTSYVFWNIVYLFTTKRARESLNYYSRNTFSLPFDFARYDRDTFYDLRHYQEFYYLTTYKLRKNSNKLQEVSTHYSGITPLHRVMYFTSNITKYLGIPSTSYWNYDLDFQLRYFRGGEEI